MRRAAARQVRLASVRLPSRRGVEPARVAELVSPLRYDVVVRAEFFRFLGDHTALYQENFAQFMMRAAAEPYFTWFETVAMTRYHPSARRDRRNLLERFEQRVRKSHAVWQSFRDRGFDTKCPITLWRTDTPVPTDSGIVIDRPWHIGDGNHRLALLVAGGASQVQPDQYRIGSRPAQLIDNTQLLVSALSIRPADYTRFLSYGYSGTPFTSIEDLVEDVRSRRPDRLSEVLDVIARHGVVSVAR